MEAIKKKEPIEWIVLTNKGNKSLLISKCCLDCKPVHTEDLDASETIWARSELRQWLNGEFFSTAFDSSEQALILETSINNSNNDYTQGGEKNTNDKVFLLSKEEVEAYLPYDKRICIPTSYAVSQGVENDIFDNGSCMWWLRSPGEEGVTYYMVADRKICSQDYDVENGIRPAMWIQVM